MNENCDRCWKCTIQVEETEKKWIISIECDVAENQSPLLLSLLWSKPPRIHFLPSITVIISNRALLLCPSHVMDWILVSPHPLDGYIEPHPWCDGNRRWGMGYDDWDGSGHEVGPSMGLVSVDEFPEHCASSLCSQVRRQHDANWKELSSENYVLAPSTHTSSRMVRNKCLLFISHQVWYFCQNRLNRLRRPHLV